jgi:uncharacterized cupredoxin-like copper-binding protein
MPATRRTSLALSVTLLALMSTSAARAAGTAIQVSLWDKGPESMMMDPMPMMGMGMGMSGGDMMKAMLGITLDVTSVPAGMVTFNVSNDSKDLVHEMVISPIASVDAALPYLKDENKIDEDAAGHVGEVAELDPGKTGTLAIDLQPGLYLLYCNIPGHFVNGMWSVLTVTP